ncbi:MAG: DUF5678 domain-containing protein [Hydrococcus sp. Prado102]|jgi:hypothetical protein|nr:DUF5678 domain-containing protein [Hydrococcus sp. Prado102]
MSILANAETNLPHFGLDAHKRTYISRQALLFDQMRSELLRQYFDKWVWFCDGKVLDADKDYQALLDRVKKQMGDKIVFVKKVSPVTTSI